MDSVRKAFIAGLAALVLGACGASDDGSSASTDTATETAATRDADLHLKRPVEPRCGVEGLATPAISRVGPGWRLIYGYPAGAPRAARPGEPTIISLDERHPRSQRVKYPNQRVMRVDGVKVNYTTQNGNFVAQWVTDRARYNVITDAGLDRLKRLVMCTP